MRTYVWLSLAGMTLAACAPATEPQTSFTWSSDVIRRNGEVVLAAADVPGEIRVSADASFGVGGSFTSLEVSPDATWLAFSTAGAAHGAGWIYDVRQEGLRPVVFQYGGSVEAEGWQDDARVSYRITTPQPDERRVTIDVRNPPAYPRLPDDTDEAGEYPADWETYRDEDLGISIRYPPEMTVEQDAEGPADVGVSLTRWGPTQERDTELFDGISISIRRGMHEDTLQSFVEDRMESARNVGSIREPLSTTTLAGREAHTFTADTLGVYTHYYLSAGPQEYLQVSVLHPDPTGQGFAETVRRILDSLQIL